MSTYIPESAMVIIAHPDDAEFGCAGTLALWAKHGARISYVLATSGDVGIADPKISREEAITIRQREQREASETACPGSEVVFLGERDGMVEATMDLRKRLVREIRRFKPEVVLTFNPQALFVRDTYINHPDHRAVGTCCLDAVFPAAGQPNLFEELEEEGLVAFKPRKVYIMMFGDGAETSVNITEVIDTKCAALEKHASQFRDGAPVEMIREWAQQNGKGKEMDYAESFKVITLESDEDWEKYKGEIAVRYTE